MRCGQLGSSSVGVMRGMYAHCCNVLAKQLAKVCLYHGIGAISIVADGVTEDNEAFCRCRAAPGRAQ